jgi:hypothetical protein
MIIQFNNFFKVCKQHFIRKEFFRFSTPLGKFLSYLKTELVNLEYIEHIFKPKN